MTRGELEQVNRELMEGLMTIADNIRGVCNVARVGGHTLGPWREDVDKLRETAAAVDSVASALQEGGQHDNLRSAAGYLYDLSNRLQRATK
jgi:hypothetical protein